MENNFSETDIRPSSLEKGQSEAINEDVKWLNDRSSKFINVNCPACDKSDHSAEFTKEGLKYVKCSYCDTVYVNPRPDADLLSEFYKRSKVYEYWSKNVYSATSDKRKKFLFRPRAKLLIEKCKKANFIGGNILEIGSSSGFFLEEVSKLNFFDDIIGIEPTPDQAKASKSKGITTYNMPYQSFHSKSKFTAIASFETIEHLYSPYEFLLWVKKYLKKGGYIMITCPNYGGIEPSALTSESGCVDHEHLNYFSPSSFRILAHRAGFNNIEITTPGSLDVDILSKAIEGNKDNKEKVGNFLTDILSSGNKNLLQNFQEFLKKYKLSSSMLVVAQKS